MGRELREQGVEFYEAQEMILQHLETLFGEVDAGDLPCTG